MSSRPRRRTPARAAVAGPPLAGKTASKSKIPVGTRVLGKGQTGTVFAHPASDALVIKRAPDMAREIEMHQLMACLGVAPAIEMVSHDKTALVMQRVEPIATGASLTVNEQQQLVALVCKSVAAGLLHNDLHQGNIGRLGGRMVMFDFGLTERIPVIQDDHVFLQVVMAQLYALIEPCSKENVSWCHAEDHENTVVADTIYGIRAGKRSTIQQLLRLRRDAQPDIARCLRNGKT